MRVFVKRLVFVLLVLVVAVPVGFRLMAYMRETVPDLTEIPAHGRLIETASGKIFVQEVGQADGPLVLFSHGTAAWSELWRPTLNAMAAQGYRAMAFDAPPFGYSQRLKGAYTRQSLARVVLDLVDALDTDVILVAHSFGAGPGVEAVMMHPQDFAGLIVVAGAIALNSHKNPKNLPLPLRLGLVRQALTASSLNNPMLTRRLLAGLIHVKSAATPKLAKMLARPFVRFGTTQAYSEWLSALVVTPDGALSTRPGEYSKLQLPVAYIWGDRDAVTPLEQGLELAKVTEQADLFILTEVGHIPQIEAPEAFQTELIKALESMSLGN